MQIKLKNFLGIGMKSGNIVSGEESCINEIKKKVYLIIVAEDASQNTKKTFSDKADYRGIPIRFIGTKEELGNCIGKRNRAVIAVKDKKIAEALLSYIDIDEQTN